MYVAAFISASQRLLIYLCSLCEGDNTSASRVLHQVSVVKSLKIPICALLAILEIQENCFLVPAVNHHSVNANSKEYLDLKDYIHTCIVNNSDESLDLTMEAVIFKQRNTKSVDTLPFGSANRNEGGAV